MYGLLPTLYSGQLLWSLLLLLLLLLWACKPCSRFPRCSFLFPLSFLQSPCRLFFPCFGLDFQSSLVQGFPSIWVFLFLCLRLSLVLTSVTSERKQTKGKTVRDQGTTYQSRSKHFVNLTLASPLTHTHTTTQHPQHHNHHSPYSSTTGYNDTQQSRCALRRSSSRHSVLRSSPLPFTQTSMSRPPCQMTP
ncbi:hypothetical protein FJTKL_11552 [Diaporthe vaccinii]|uniref:Uncharacterized protein n=1 Tax=Diaporthe vaccinii TaxID=105482 RepID=A0ABR4EG11_9PEZI